VWDRKPLYCTAVPGEAGWVAGLNPGEQDCAAIRPRTPPPEEPGMRTVSSSVGNEIHHLHLPSMTGVSCSAGGRPCHAACLLQHACEDS
jgi:hypothetical protein